MDSPTGRPVGRQKTVVKQYRHLCQFGRGIRYQQGNLNQCQRTLQRIRSQQHHTALGRAAHFLTNPVFLFNNADDSARSFNMKKQMIAIALAASFAAPPLPAALKNRCLTRSLKKRKWLNCLRKR